jgi:hypothetical protein
MRTVAPIRLLQGEARPRRRQVDLRPRARGLVVYDWAIILYSVILMAPNSLSTHLTSLHCTCGRCWLLAEGAWFVRGKTNSASLSASVLLRRSRKNETTAGSPPPDIVTANGSGSPGMPKLPASARSVLDRPRTAGPVL